MGGGRLKIALGLQNKQSGVIIKDRKIYNMQANYIVTLNRALSDIRTYPLDLVPCSETYFKNEGGMKEAVLPKMDNLMCLADFQPALPLDLQNLNISGGLDKPQQKMIEIIMEKCTIDCNPIEDIDEFLSTSRIAIYSLNYLPNFRDQKEPYKPTVTGTFIDSDHSLTKLLSLNYKSVNVETDAGLFGKEIETDKYIMIDNYQQGVRTQSADSPVIIKTDILASQNREKHTRTYKKIGAFIAEIGGLLKSVAIFALLYTPFLKRIFMRAVITDLYELEKSETVTHLNLNKAREEQILESKKNITKEPVFDQNIELLYHNSRKVS